MRPFSHTSQSRGRWRVGVSLTNQTKDDHEKVLVALVGTAMMVGAVAGPALADPGDSGKSGAIWRRQTRWQSRSGRAFGTRTHKQADEIN